MLSFEVMTFFAISIRFICKYHNGKKDECYGDDDPIFQEFWL